MNLPAGIGPHEGRELELMLAGTKPCAMFYDVLPSTQFIPDDDYAPYVNSGTLVRISHDIVHNEHTIRYVFFTLPGHEWRAEALLKLRGKGDEGSETMTGQLLGYSDTEIQAFLAHKLRN